MEGCTDGGRPHFPGPSVGVPLLSHGCPFLSSPSICPWGHPHLSAISRARVASCSVLTGINLTCFSQEREKGRSLGTDLGEGTSQAAQGRFLTVPRRPALFSTDSLRGSRGPIGKVSLEIRRL